LDLGTITPVRRRLQKAFKKFGIVFYTFGKLVLQAFACFLILQHQKTILFFDVKKSKPFLLIFY